jgi:hypothetical protein
MKSILIAFIAIGCFTTWADNLTTKGGKVYQNVTIVSANPERMLVVHDGGGCQVDFKNLADHSLTAEQRKTVEEELRYYVKRTERLERVRAEREAFEMAQREKGRVEFEGGWVTPMEREEILLNRAERKVELERKRVLLAKERAELEKELLQTERARNLLEGESRRGTTYVSYGYYRPYRRDCVYPDPYRYEPDCSWRKNDRSMLNVGFNNSLLNKSQSSACFSFDNVSTYNRGPFNR